MSLPERSCRQVALPRLSRLAGAQQPRRHPALPRLLGLQPDHLIPLSPSESAPLYVEMMGGAEKIIARGQELHDEGKYLLARRSSTSWCRPSREPGRQGPARRHLRAARLPAGEPGPAQQLPRRRLRAALRHPAGRDRRFQQPRRDPRDVDRAVPQLPRHPHGQPQGRGTALHHEPRSRPTTARKFLIELENATLTNIQGFQAEKPDLTLTINRSDLEQTMMGAKTARGQIKDGTAKAEGDVSILGKARGNHGRVRSALRDHARHQNCHVL
jgi:hypothetical protein